MTKTLIRLHDDDFLVANSRIDATKIQTRGGAVGFGFFLMQGAVGNADRQSINKWNNHVMKTYGPALICPWLVPCVCMRARAQMCVHALKGQ